MGAVNASSSSRSSTSGKRRRISQIELFIPGAKADQLTAWYADKIEADDEKAFLEACPDNHLFRSTAEFP